MPRKYAHTKLNSSSFDGKSNIVLGYYINSATGNVSSDYHNFYCETYFDCKPNTSYLFYGERKEDGWISRWNRIHWYDSNKVFISSSSHSAGTKTIAESPNNARYVRISCNVEDTAVSVTQEMLDKYNWYLGETNQNGRYVSTQFGIEQIDGYKKLEYIESDGTQYIDTNYIFTNNKHKTIIKFNNIKPVGSDSVYWACGSYVNASTRSGGIGLQTSGYLGLGLGDIGMASTNIRIDNPTTPIELTIQSNGNGTFSMTGGSVDYINQNVGGNVITGKTELLFGPNANGTKSSQVKMKLYYVKLYDNDVLVRHFIPCESNDNRIGMYDLCNSGKNLFDKNAFNSDIVHFRKLRNDDGVETTDSSSCYSDYTIKVKPNTNYGVSPQDTSQDGGLERIYFLDENKNWISRTNNFSGKQTIITTPNNCSYMQFQIKNRFDVVVNLLDIQVEEGSLITTYEPYPFYTNNGTGEFIKGSYISSIHYYIPIRQLQKYIELEYLESSGTQYIDTNVMIDDMNYVIKSDLMYCSTGTQVIYGEMNSANGYPGILINGAGDFRYGTSERHILSSPFVRDTKYSTELSFKKLKLDGVEIIATETTNTSPLAHSIYLFARNNMGGAGNHSSARIYNWSISHNGELIKDLIPVKRNIDGILGMYDRVNDVFYTNRGSGNFIAGPEK